MIDARGADDAARLIVRLTLDQVPGIVNGVDTRAAADAEVADWLAARLDLPPAPRREASEGPRENKQIASVRLPELPFYHRYPDYRAGYSAMLASDSRDQ